MVPVFWGRGLFVGGLVALVLSTAPALILSQLPPRFSDTFFGPLAGLLLLTVAPLALLFASAGAILLLVVLFRRLRGRERG